MPVLRQKGARRVLIVYAPGRAVHIAKFALTPNKNTAKVDAMGKSALVTRSHTHTALAEHEQRLRMVEIRDRIFESRVLDLAIAMAATGRDLYIDPETGEIKDNGALEPKIRQGYVHLLLNKLVSNAAAPKEITPEPDFGKWIDIISKEVDKESGDDS